MCMGSLTTQSQSAARNNAPDRIAFHSGDGVGALIANFRSSMPSPSVPLFTLHRTLRSARRKTRGRVDRYSFLVRLFHPLFHAGSSRRTTTFFPATASDRGLAAGPGWSPARPAAPTSVSPPLRPASVPPIAPDPAAPLTTGQRNDVLLAPACPAKPLPLDGAALTTPVPGSLADSAFPLAIRSSGSAPHWRLLGAWAAPQRVVVPPSPATPFVPAAARTSTSDRFPADPA